MNNFFLKRISVSIPINGKVFVEGSRCQSDSADFWVQGFTCIEIRGFGLGEQSHKI